MASSSSNIKDPVTVKEIQDIGRRLISLPSSHVEQFHLLDRIENVLRKITQSSPQAVIEALKPIMKALVADVLLKSGISDVKISVASCIGQIMRITAPDHPYSDEELKIYFQVSVSAFKKLSSLSYLHYTKAVSILESFAECRMCRLMLDLELDREIVDMFRNLFCSARSNLWPNLLFYVKRTMTLVIEESEELSDEIIMLLLDNLKMENRKAYPFAWELGVEILKNCGNTLKKYIPEAVESMSLDLNDFAEIIASICHDASRKKLSEVKEAVPEANEDEKPIAIMKGTNSRSKRSAKGEGSKRTNKKQRTESEIIATTSEEMQGGLDTTQLQPKELKQRTMSEILATTTEVTIAGLENTEAKPEKRKRKPNSLLMADEGYWIPQLKRSS